MFAFAKNIDSTNTTQTDDFASGHGKSEEKSGLTKKYIVSVTTNSEPVIVLHHLHTGIFVTYGKMEMGQ